MPEEKFNAAATFDSAYLRRLILPLIVEQLLAILVGLADSVMVSYVSESAMSAVSLVDAVNVLLIQVFAALATGGAVVAGQYLGRRENGRANASANQLAVFMGLLSLAVMALMYLGRNLIIHGLFGAIDADVADNAMTYLLIVSASIPFIALYNAGAALFRVMGNSRVSMNVSIIMNIINISGNALLVFYFRMGVAGVAWPTLVSRAFAAVVIILLLLSKKNEICLPRPISLRLDRGIIRNILWIGVPNGIESGMFQLGKLLLLSLVSGFGTASIAANSMGNSICSFQILGGQSISLAIITVVSRCVGAGDYAAAREYTKKLMKLAYISMWALCAGVLALLPLILRLYSVSAEAESLATTIIWIHGVFGMTVWPLAFTLPNTLRAAGDTRFTMTVSAVSMWTVRIGAGYLIGGYMGFGVVGVWVAMIIDWFVRLAFFVWRYRGDRWEKMALR
jgi:putative MATE family efflux protein